MKCVECEKALQEQTVATKTKKTGGHVIVLQSRQALVCATHGVVAWDPPARPISQPYIPYVPVYPQPLMPFRPYVYPGSGTAKPWINQPYIGTITATMGNNTAANLSNYSTLQLTSGSAR